MFHIPNVELKHRNHSQGGGALKQIRDVEVLEIRDKYEKGMTVADLALEYGYCDKTIRKWLKRKDMPNYKRRPKKPSKLDPYKEYIMNRMADGVFNCEILIREIREQGYTGGKTILKDFVAPFRKQFKITAVRRFETKPGEQMQADWGYLGTFLLDERLRKVYIFVIVLGYSRYLVAYCTNSMDLETLLLCHQRCFAMAGGIAEQIVYDNMKTVTIGRDLDHKPIWQARFLEFANYYGFRPVAHTPYKPRSKGKVERAIDYIKRNFCPGRHFTDLTDLNQQLQQWLDTVANVRIHGTTGCRPVDRLGQETLRPLPQKAFPTAVRLPRKASRDCYVSYLGVLFSVPWAYAGCNLEVEELAGGIIKIWWHNQVIAEHELPRDNRRRVTQASHFAGLLSAQRENRANGLRQVYPVVEQRSLDIYEQFAGVQQ